MSCWKPPAYSGSSIPAARLDARLVLSDFRLRLLDRFPLRVFGFVANAVLKGDDVIDRIFMDLERCWNQEIGKLQKIWA